MKKHWKYQYQKSLCRQNPPINANDHRQSHNTMEFLLDSWTVRRRCAAGCCGTTPSTAAVWWTSRCSTCWCTTTVSNVWVTVMLVLYKNKNKQPFNGSFSRTTLVHWYQIGKTVLDINVLGWQWPQSDHMQTTCTLLQPDNHADTSSLKFCGPDNLPDAQPTVSKHWKQLVQYTKCSQYSSVAKHAHIPTT